MAIVNLHIHDQYNPVTKEMGLQGVAPFIWDNADSHANYTKPDETKMDIIDLMIPTAPDYKCGRDYMKAVMMGLGATEEEAFDNLASQFKPICAAHKLGTLDQRIAELGVQGNIAVMIKYRVCTQEARQNRALHADVWVQNELPDNKIEIMNASMQFFDNYKKFGIEGIDQGDSVQGVDDYLHNKNGVSGGLAAQSYNPQTMTLSALVNKLSDILTKGIY